jgi:hypothetical protein
MKNRILGWLYEIGYDYWLWLGCKLDYLHILWNTQEYVKYEYYVDGKMKDRNHPIFKNKNDEK